MSGNPSAAQQAIADACGIKASFVLLPHSSCEQLSFYQIRFYFVHVMQVVIDHTVHRGQRKCWVLLDDLLSSGLGRSAGRSLTSYPLEPLRWPTEKSIAPWSERTNQCPSSRCGTLTTLQALREQRFKHVAMHIRQAAFGAIMVIGDLLVIQTEEVQDRRIKVISAGHILHGSASELVGGAM